MPVCFHPNITHQEGLVQVCTVLCQALQSFHLPHLRGQTGWCATELHRSDILSPTSSSERTLETH
eukprot:m.601375 g.601375  ORF g.601375 m.601375 type:complete len:65 (+) comp58087_c0_seq9:1184-1378(+)